MSRMTMMLRTLAVLTVMVATTAQASPWPAEGRWVDLGHEYSDETLYWPTADGFHKDTVFEGETEGGFYYTAYNVTTAEHGGTHLDAPIHFFEDRDTVDAIPLQRLIAPAVVIDVRSAVAGNADYQVSVEDITDWEQDFGRIPDGAIVLFNTGWSQHWPDAEKYLGTAEKGPQAVAKLHFPGIHPDAAELLANERAIASVGLDTASIDFGQSTAFMTHQILFEKNIPGFENLNGLERLPPTGTFVVALPMKIKGGSGGPLRIVAFIPE